MAKEENLRPIELSHDEAVENGRKGGIASGKARKEKKLMKEALEELLAKEYTDKSGITLDGTTMLMVAAMNKAQKGDMRALEFIRDTVGQKPVERIESVEIAPEVYERVERALRGE